MLHRSMISCVRSPLPIGSSMTKLMDLLRLRVAPKRRCHLCGEVIEAAWCEPCWNNRSAQANPRPG